MRYFNTIILVSFAIFLFDITKTKDMFSVTRRVAPKLNYQLSSNAVWKNKCLKAPVLSFHNLLYETEADPSHKHDEDDPDVGQPRHQGNGTQLPVIRKNARTKKHLQIEHA